MARAVQAVRRNAAQAGARWLLGALLCGLSGCNVITFNRQLTLRSYARLQIRPQERELSSGHLRYYAGGQGFPVLLEHAIKGYRLMPARGGNGQLADEDVANALGYIVSESQ